MLVICAGAFLVTLGCNDNSKITVYRVPKETKPQMTDQVSVRGDAGAIVRWKAPNGWEEQPATGFRKGSFIVRDPDGRTADISVVSFPESAGGLLANVNRWRAQLKLAPVNEIDQSITPLSVDGHQIFFVDMVSEQPVLDGGLKSRVLGGILATGSETWFFKMSGEDKLVASQRDAFRQFLETLEIGKGSATTATSTNAPTPSAGKGAVAICASGWLAGTTAFLNARREFQSFRAKRKGSRCVGRFFAWSGRWRSGECQPVA